ncbi:HDOD domain-containing protein [Exilibacterium tricleocarpae]|uniref:HDOD domain-containing protein n=1 Tax=Exilibacterium tricleocarpae TaxID=2591008 RepID=A0A545TFR4_9GAMM|nr:HDOD domain-containing protein [Exilibacterium tricleocarpae]TQV76060.1 HDOD domain-containing protein [Exilibacterium tricleocarpae]
MLTRLMRRWFKHAPRRDEAHAGARVQTDSATISPLPVLGQDTIETRFYTALIPPASGAQPPLTVPQKLTVDLVRKNLMQADKLPQAIPHLPAVIPRLLRSLRDPEASVRDYADIIEREPAISGAVLKLANTVYFNPAGKAIASIETAVVKLGIMGLRTVLAAAVMQPVVQRSSPYFSQFGEKLWHHSLTCAVACEIIARHYQSEPFKAYMAGLVHDMGKITVFSELCREFALNPDSTHLGGQAFVPLMRALSGPLSHQIAQTWQLPEAICTALAQQINIGPGSRVSTYGLILYQANKISEVLCAAQLHPQAAAEQLCRALQLPDTLPATLRKVSMGE